MSAEEFLPPGRASLSKLRQAVQGCQGCDLYRDATQAVFGEGRVKAQVALIGETPGDVEDVEGHPFVGPAGRLLDRALHELGADRAQVYLTNAVKHFRWRPADRGKRRIHQTPTRTHIVACRPWLVTELNLVPTVHPSSVLRADDREAAYRDFLKDLAVAFKAA